MSRLKMFIFGCLCTLRGNVIWDVCRDLHANVVGVTSNGGFLYDAILALQSRNRVISF